MRMEPEKLSKPVKILVLSKFLSLHTRHTLVLSLSVRNEWARVACAIRLSRYDQYLKTLASVRAVVRRLTALPPLAALLFNVFFETLRCARALFAVLCIIFRQLLPVQLRQHADVVKATAPTSQKSKVVSANSVNIANPQATEATTVLHVLKWVLDWLGATMYPQEAKCII